jgi:hypothetical protein
VKQRVRGSAFDVAAGELLRHPNETTFVETRENVARRAFDLRERVE